jgi:hypothetical protein
MIMQKNTRIIVFIIIAVAAFGLFFAFKFFQKEEAAQIPNPASQNCIQKGGRIEIRSNKNGEYGVCLFEDNRQCEEWALLRGQCPFGGLKITGYQTDAEVYCAITGGQVENLEAETPVCRRVDGTYCNVRANLDGECPDPNDPNPNAGNGEDR